MSFDSGETKLETTMVVKRRIRAEEGGWTITDANLSPDNQRY
jgi:hypothetical protein